MTQTNAGKRRRLAAVPGCHTLLPMTEITGAEPGPAFLITAGIHGGEYPAMAASMELAEALTPIISAIIARQVNQRRYT